MTAFDFRRIGGPIPLDLWLDLATFVVLWDSDEVAGLMVGLGVEPEDAGDHELGEDARWRLGEIVRCIEEHLARTDQRVAPDAAARFCNLMQRETCEDLLRRVGEVLASVSFTSKGGVA